jgi:hypothetical protein
MTHQHPLLLKAKWDFYVEKRRGIVESIQGMNEIAQYGFTEQEMVDRYPEFTSDTIRKIRLQMDTQVERMQSRSDPKPKIVFPALPTDLRGTLDRLMGKVFCWFSLPNLSDLELETQLQALILSRTQEDLPIYWLLQNEAFSRREEGIFGGKTNCWLMEEFVGLDQGIEETRLITDFPNKQAWSELLNGLQRFQKSIGWWLMELSDEDPLGPELGKRELAFCDEIFMKYQAWSWKRAEKEIGRKSKRLEQMWTLRIHEWENREWTPEELERFRRFGTEKITILRWHFPNRTTKAIEEKRNALGFQSSSSSDSDIIGIEELEDAPLIQSLITNETPTSLRNDTSLLENLMDRYNINEETTFPAATSLLLVKLQYATWYKYLWKSEPKEAIQSRMKLTQFLEIQPDDPFLLEIRMDLMSNSPLAFKLHDEIPDLLLKKMRKHARSGLRQTSQILFTKKDIPVSPTKELTEEESHAEAINVTKNVLWEAERYSPEALRQELPWLRSQVDKIFQTKDRSLLLKFDEIFKEVFRSVHTSCFAVRGPNSRPPSLCACLPEVLFF